MWRNYLPITAAVLLGFGHVALSAQTAPDQAAQSAAENAIDEYQQAFDGRDYPAAIKALDKVSVEANNRQARALLAAMRASALLGLKRNSEADALIAQARELAEECVRRDPECRTPGFADAVRQTGLLAEGDWLERS